MAATALQQQHAPAYSSVESSFASMLQSSWTKQDYYQRVLNVFPDLSLRYLAEIYDNHSVAISKSSDPTDATARPFNPENLCILLIEEVMTNAKYPKQKDQLAQEKYESDARLESEREALLTLINGKYYSKLVEIVMKQEFPGVTVEAIKTYTKTGKSIDKIYPTLTAISLARSRNATVRPLKRRKHESILWETFPPKLVNHVQSELAKARKASVQVPSPTQAGQPEMLVLDETAECGCCFDDTFISKTTYCSGDPAHVFCYDCTAMLVKTDIGQARCRSHCMDSSGCKAPFAEHQLRLCLDQKTMQHLTRLRQQEDLKTAGIEGLEDCPFCDYMDVCRPVAVDREFRCQNEDCGIVSCRRCHKESHTPLSCKQAAEERAKDKKIDARHVLEEAMTEALVRTCNKSGCKAKFVKTDGCNSMHCPKCQNHQCYVCSKDITGYEHFGNGNKCPLHDAAGVESRHVVEVKIAETAARAKIQAEQPDIADDDLDIKPSDAVKKQETDAQARAAQRNQHLFAVPDMAAVHRRIRRARLRRNIARLDPDQRVEEQRILADDRVDAFLNNAVPAPLDCRVFGATPAPVSPLPQIQGANAYDPNLHTLGNPAMHGQQVNAAQYQPWAFMPQWYHSAPPPAVHGRQHVAPQDIPQVAPQAARPMRNLDDIYIPNLANNAAPPDRPSTPPEHFTFARGFGFRPMKPVHNQSIATSSRDCVNASIVDLTDQPQLQDGQRSRYRTGPFAFDADSTTEHDLERENGPGRPVSEAWDCMRCIGEAKTQFKENNATFKPSFNDLYKSRRQTETGNRYTVEQDQKSPFGPFSAATQPAMADPIRDRKGKGRAVEQDAKASPAMFEEPRQNVPLRLLFEQRQQPGSSRFGTMDKAFTFACAARKQQGNGSRQQKPAPVVDLTGSDDAEEDYEVW